MRLETRMLYGDVPVSSPGALRRRRDLLRAAALAPGFRAARPQDQAVALPRLSGGVEQPPVIGGGLVCVDSLHPGSAEGAPTSRSADAADGTSTEGTARHLGIADAAPARKDMEEAKASDIPGQV